MASLSQRSRCVGGRFRVRRVLFCAGIAAWVAAVPANWSTPAAAAQTPVSPPVVTNRATFERYCLTCHTTRQKERGTVPIALDTLDLSRIPADAAVWEKVVLKLRAGVMPPAGSPRPDKATHDGLASWLEAELDRSWTANPDPGRTEPLHRLNRVEYRNAVRDLLDLDLDVSALLPGDDVSYGFDNIAGVLKLSPTLMERYLSAAQRVSRLAVGTPTRTPSIDYYRITDDLSQDVQLPGLPLGTRGGTRISYAFPMDAVYEIRPRLTRDLNESLPLYTEPQVLEISIDGQRVGTFTLPGIGAREGRGAPPPAEPPAEPPVSSAAVARSGTGAPGDLADCADRPRQREGAAVAQPRRRVLEPACAGEGRAARRGHHVPQSCVGARRDRASAVPASVSGGRQHSRDASRRVSAERRDRRPDRRDRAWTVGQPPPHLHLFDEG